jgi:hypothetical protein
MYKKLILICLLVSLSGCGNKIEKWSCDYTLFGEEMNTIITLDFEQKTMLAGNHWSEPFFENGNKITWKDSGTGWTLVLDRDTGNYYHRGEIEKECSKI